MILGTDGFSVDTASTLGEAREALQRFIPDVVLMDLNLPDGKGLDLLQYLPLQPPDAVIPVIVMTGNATVESAIEGLRHGIWDYLLKPVSLPRLRSLLARVPRPYELTEEVRALRAELRQLGRFGPMVGRAAATQHVFDAIEQVAQTEAALLIVGAPGTGKEIAARTIHETSRRKKGPFINFDCRLPSNGERSFASLLFGHERYAAAQIALDGRESGALEQAAGGTLFIDQLTALPLAHQHALATTLQARNFRRVGGSHDIPTDFRFICSMNENPHDAIKAGRLLEGLLTAFSDSVLTLPELHERVEDIPLLAQHFVEQFNARDGVQKRLSPNCVAQLAAREWTGNVRELQQCVEAAHRGADDVIESLQADDSGSLRQSGNSHDSVQIAVGMPLAEVEELLIRATLEAVGGTRHRAASMLGISPKTLYNKLQRMKMV